MAGLDPNRGEWVHFGSAPRIGQPRHPKSHLDFKPHILIRKCKNAGKELTSIPFLRDQYTGSIFYGKQTAAILKLSEITFIARSSM